MQDSNVKPTETGTDKKKSNYTEAAKVIALGPVMAHIGYPNALYAELPESDIRKLTYSEHDCKNYNRSEEIRQ